jgi:hypothetical protein
MQSDQTPRLRLYLDDAEAVDDRSGRRSERGDIRRSRNF